MDRVTPITHQGKQIVFVDFSDCNMGQVLQVIAEATPLIRAQPPRSALILCDFTNSSQDPRMISALKEFTAGNQPYVKASTITGVTGMQRVLYDAVMKFTGRTIQIHEDCLAAKEWLAAQ